MARTTQPRRRAEQTEDTDDLLFNGVILADLAIGLFWGGLSAGYVAMKHMGTKVAWHSMAWFAFWLVGLVAVMAGDVFFRLIAERDQPLYYRLFRSQRGGVLLTMPVWLVSIVVLGVALAFSTGDGEPGAKVHIQTNSTAEPTTEPTAKPADR
ncbi:MAG: hypothetical protein HZB16_12860 [Armatimonadetes bacterium]|nr:hypothetical protein [Armatimonadota bacterium]